uniref:CUB domain-containing protein n=1 Tax=Plectus sambesii TaxID=2011161 RepID=A0A914VAC3_9BILA
MRDSNCGGDIAATYNWQEISNPNQEMYANQNCNWRIRAPTGTQILYQITNSDFGCQDSCVNYIEVKSTKDYAPTGFRVCCTPPTTLLASDTNEMLLLYHTDSSVRPGYKGFRLRFIIDGEPPATTTTSTTTTTTTTTTTPSTTTTTKTTTTTPEETTTNEPSPTPVATGQWGTWTAWGGCSISCGGCGISRRVRTCYGGNLWCKGNPDESKPCGTAVCPDNSRRCYGQIVAPCNLLSRIHFDRAANGQALLDPRAIFSQPGLDLNFDKEQSSSVSEFLNLRRRTFSRVRRRRSTCMSKFSYDCRSQGITLKITWVDQTALQANDQKLSQPCCVGFKENNGICVAE